MGLMLPLLIGLALGAIAALFGAGGGVVAVPLFVLALGLPNPVATGTSLGVIAVAALVGTAAQARARLVHWRAALWLAPTAMLGAQGGARLNPLAPQVLTLSCFVVLLLLAAARMARAPEPAPSSAETPVELPRLALAGLGLVAGVVIGFLGVSGGFVLVPVLRTLVKLPMKRATATSLAIMSASSVSGAVGFALQGLVRVEVLLPAGAGALVGALLGVALSARLQAELLRKAFVVLALAVAARVAWSVVGLLRS